MAHKTESETPCVGEGSMTLVDINRRLLETGEYSDTTIVVTDYEGKSKRFKVHKVHLMARSVVFREMFTDPLTTGQEIFINDVNIAAFELLLKYVYTDTDEFLRNPHLVMHLLHAAKKFKLYLLHKECQTYLNGNVVATTACAILDQALFYIEADVVRHCMNIIKCFTEAALTQPNCSNIRSDTLQNILDADFITGSEMLLFELCYRWAVQQCKEHDLVENGENIRKVLGSLLYQIRFPTLTTDEFLQVTLRDVIKAEEETVMWRLIHSTTPTGSQIAASAKKTPEMIAKDLFNIKKRSLIGKQILVYDTESNSDWHMSTTINVNTSVTYSITIEANLPIQIQQIFLPIPYSQPFSNYPQQLQITIKETRQNTVFTVCDSTVQYGVQHVIAPSNRTEMTLSPPIELSEDDRVKQLTVTLTDNRHIYMQKYAGWGQQYGPITMQVIKELETVFMDGFVTFIARNTDVNNPGLPILGLKYIPWVSTPKEQVT